MPEAHDDATRPGSTRRLLRLGGRLALWSLAAIGAAVVLLVVYIAIATTRWPRIANPEALVAQCRTLAAEFQAGRVPDNAGRRPGDRGWGTEVAALYWPPAVRGLEPAPRRVRVNDPDSVTIFQAAGAFGGWGVIVCVSGPRCVEPSPDVVPTAHPQIFHFQTDY